MNTVQYVMPAATHNELVVAAYRKRGYTREEAEAGACVAELAARHGIKTHNALKALHLDELLGSSAGGCKPGAEIQKLPSKYKAIERWNANRKLGQAVGLLAIEACMKLADEFGVGCVAVDNAFHYLWGGGYVMEAAKKGYIAYTCCTAALAEVVPHGGRTATLGTNPHSWGFPTTEVVGFPICVDWATSVIAMGRVQQLAREGLAVPPGSAVDEAGNETSDPARVRALLPFGGHKGYGLSLIDELLAAYTGGSLPTIRSRWELGRSGEKHTPCFFFQCIHADALGCDDFAGGRTQSQNVKAVLEDILGHGNDGAILPGELEARAAAKSAEHGGLLFTEAEVDAFGAVARDAAVPFDARAFKRIEA